MTLAALALPRLATAFDARSTANRSALASQTSP